MDEETLHQSKFPMKDKAKEIQSKLKLPETTEKEIENWLKKNKKRFKDEILDGFNYIKKIMGLTNRYLNYFVSCVLSDHSGDTYPHSLPKGFRLAITRKDLEGHEVFSRDGYYKLYYYPVRKIPDKYNWEAISPPRAFTVMWPNMQYYNLHLKSLEFLVNKVKEYYGENLVWRVRRGYSFKYTKKGQWCDGPLIVAGKNTEIYGKPIRDVLDLPGDVPVVRSFSPLPYIYFDNNQGKYNIIGGAALDINKEPHVKRDPTIDGEDKKYADRCEKVINLICGNEDLTKPGTKRKYASIAKRDYEAFVKNMYRNKLKERKEKYNDIKNTDVQDEIWNSVTTNAVRYKNKYDEFPDDASYSSDWRKPIHKELGIE